MRHFVSDPLHRAIFPDCTISDDSDSVHRFHLILGGAYYAVGAGGPITGRGADLLLIDDPIKAARDANSAAYRRSLEDWYQNVVYPRLEPGGAIVLIQTRWHEADLAGWLLKEHAAEGWKLISLPAIAEVDEGWRKVGDPLWPRSFRSKRWLESKRRSDPPRGPVCTSSGPRPKSVRSLTAIGGEHIPRRPSTSD